MIKNLLWGVLGFLLAGILFWILSQNNSNKNINLENDNKEIKSFRDCVVAGNSVTKSIPMKCFDGTKTFTQGEMISIEGDNGIGDGDHSNFINFLKEKDEQEKKYKNIPVLEENEFEVEVSRSLRECGLSEKKCLQVKKEDGDWELVFGSILGFKYIEGDYYVLKIREIKYDFSKINKEYLGNIPENIWELKEIIKHIPAVKNYKKNKTTILKIPSVDFDEEGRIVTKFKEYEISETKSVLSATLKKLFELRSGGNVEFGDGKWNGLKFDYVKLNTNGVGEVFLKGQWYPLGDMSGFYFREEIEAAAKQFITVKNIKVYLNNKIFDWCVDSNADPEEDGCDKKQKLWDTSLKRDI